MSVSDPIGMERESLGSLPECTNNKHEWLSGLFLNRHGY